MGRGTLTTRKPACWLVRWETSWEAGPSTLTSMAPGSQPPSGLCRPVLLSPDCTWDAAFRRGAGAWEVSRSMKCTSPGGSHGLSVLSELPRWCCWEAGAEKPCFRRNCLHSRPGWGVLPPPVADVRQKWPLGCWCPEAVLSLQCDCFRWSDQAHISAGHLNSSPLSLPSPLRA